MRGRHFGRFNPENFREFADKKEEKIQVGDFVEDDVVDVLLGDREMLAEKEKAENKYREFRINKALEAEKIMDSEEQPSLVEHQNKKEKLDETVDMEEVVMFDEKITSGKVSIERHGVLWGKEFNRYGELAHSDGEAVETASVSLNLVKSEGGLNLDEMVAAKIDSEGANDPSELDPETSDEALDRGGRELVERYLENIFRKFDGQVYRVGDVNEYAMGHSVDFSSDGSDLVYGLPYSRAEEMHGLMEEGAEILRANDKAKFSKQIGLNIDALRKNDFGFTRNIEVDGKTYTIKFVYLKEKTGQDSAENDILEAA